ncbi:facilitated trehalose transporter Tret1-like [Vespa crabro]|uniref:facilitated trehalose transporter Tret1-like n=1 Tax=Vespa crabro TaxID=7445 RepID=UPI001F02390F|nr:facilitated trehalose transporter Tret1-like [Vespa crabro]XP_046813862.1 facilitated trehalose transporter Tret1-like [Vespa crabro]
MMGDIKERMDDPGKFRQFVAAMVVNLAAMTYGSMIGWQSPMSPQLQSENPPVGTIAMTNDEVSWLSGIMCLGGIITTPMMGPLSEKLGRKLTGCLIGLPFLICSFLTIFATEQIHIFIARFFAGIGGAGALFLVPLYVSEISCDSIRGMLGSLVVLVVNFGILITYILGGFLSYNICNICIAVLPVIYLGSFLFLPETPVYLIRRNRLREADRSLMWLRAGHQLTVERELLRLQIAAKEAATLSRSIGLKDLFRNKGTIKGLVIGLGIFAGQQLCGIFAMTSYTETIFRISGSSLSPNTAVIIVGAIQVAGSYLSTSLMERTGRRPLLLISCLGMCICHYILGIFCYLQELNYDVSTFGWIPVIALSAYMITYCLGLGPGPYVICSEIFDQDLSSLAITVALFFTWVVAFIVVKFFANVVDLFGMYGCFFILGTSCISTFIFIYILVPETKGRSREDILNELNGGDSWASTIADVKISSTDA